MKGASVIWATTDFGGGGVVLSSPPIIYLFIYSFIHSSIHPSFLPSHARRHIHTCVHTRCETERRVLLVVRTDTQGGFVYETSAAQLIIQCDENGSKRCLAGEQSMFNRSFFIFFIPVTRGSMRAADAVRFLVMYEVKLITCQLSILVFETMFGLAPTVEIRISHHLFLIYLHSLVCVSWCLHLRCLSTLVRKRQSARSPRDQAIERRYLAATRIFNGRTRAVCF